MRSALVCLLLCGLSLPLEALMSDEKVSRDFFFDEKFAHHDYNVYKRTIALSRSKVDTRSTPNVRGEKDGSWRLFRSDDTTVEDGPRRTYIVQVHHPSTHEDRERIQGEIGVRFGNYVPHHAYTIYATPAEAHRAVDVKGVAWVGPYLPDYKLSNDVAALASKSLLRTERLKKPTPNLFVLLPPLGAGQTRSHNQASEVAQAWGAGLRERGVLATVTAASSDKILVEVQPSADASVVEYLSQQHDAFYVEIAPEYKVLNKYSKWISQSGTKDSSTGRTPIRDAGITGDNMIVAVADTGLDLSNCLFYDAGGAPPTVGSNTNHRKVKYYEVITSNDNTDDVGGHGSHVCGSVLGKADPPSSTVSDWNGMAFNAKLYFQDIEKTGGNLAVPSDLNTGLFPNAYAGGARIHSDSWGSSDASYTSHAMEVDKYMYTNTDMLVLIAAGNDGKSAESISSTIGSPATSKNCLAVGASRTSNAAFLEDLTYFNWEKRIADAKAQGVTDCCKGSAAAIQYCCQDGLRKEIQANANNRYDIINVAPFSSRGPTSDGRVKPEVMSPGEQIVSTNSDGSNTASPHCDPGATSGNANAALLAMAGTSMATPTTAGLAALVRQYYVEGWYPGGSKGTGTPMASPSAALLKATLINSAVALTGQIDLGNNGTWVALGQIPSIFQGFGRIQLDQALYLSSTTGARNLYVSDQLYAIGTDDYVNFCIPQVSTGTPSPLKATVVWTDKEGAPSASVALVNDLNLYMGTDDKVYVGNWGDKKDQRNNVEQYIIQTPAAGQTYKVQVKGANVAQGPQKFAVVITGSFSPAAVTIGGKGTGVSGACTFSYTDNFAVATEAEYFPYGVAIGVGVGAGALGVIGMLVMACIKNPGMFSKLLKRG